MRVSPQTPGVFGVVAYRGGGEEGEVPVFGDVPIEGVEGVQEDEEEPEAEETGFAHADFSGFVTALESTEDDDWEGAGVF